MIYMRAFTLIELLVIIGIISVLTTMVLVNYQDFITRSTIRTRVTDIADFIRYSQFLSSVSFVKGVTICGAGVEKDANNDACNNIDLSKGAVSGFEFVKISVENNLLNSYSIERTKAVDMFNPLDTGFNASLLPSYSTVSKGGEDGGSLLGENYTVDIFLNENTDECDKNESNDIRNYDAFVYFERPDTRPNLSVINKDNNEAICADAKSFRIEFGVSSGGKSRSIIVKPQGLITID